MGDGSPDAIMSAWKTGISFGLTSGVITTLGLIVGLYSGTGSRLAVIGGILTIAVADAMSDALGIHISEESRPTTSNRHVWTATAATFLAKFTMAISFIVPVLLLPLERAILTSIAWGALVITALSWQIARAEGARPGPVVGEHLAIAAVVVIATHYVGVGVALAFPENG